MLDGRGVVIRIPVNTGYVEPLYRQPMYQRGIAMGRHGFPFAGSDGSIRRYPDGICPVTERMHERELLYLSFLHAGLMPSDLEDVATAFEKVLTSTMALR